MYKLYKIFSTVPAVKTFQFKHRFRSHRYLCTPTEVLRNSEHPNAFYCTCCTLIPPLFCHLVTCHTVTDMYAMWQVVLGILCRCEQFVLYYSFDFSRQKLNLQLTTPVILSSFLSRPFEVYDAHIQKMWLRIIPPETSYQYQYTKQQMHLIKYNTIQWMS